MDLPCNNIENDSLSQTLLWLIASLNNTTCDLERIFLPVSIFNSSNKAEQCVRGVERIQTLPYCQEDEDDDDNENDGV